MSVRASGAKLFGPVLVVVGVNADGRREILGLDVATAEDGAGWLAFLRGLRARGLKNVELVISDAHPGLKDAHGLVATFVRTIFAQPDAESVKAQHARTVEHLAPRFKDAAKMLADAEEIRNRPGMDVWRR